jgi:hypothetical protein
VLRRTEKDRVVGIAHPLLLGDPVERGVAGGGQEIDPIILVQIGGQVVLAGHHDLLEHVPGVAVELERDG